MCFHMFYINFEFWSLVWLDTIVFAVDLCCLSPEMCIDEHSTNIETSSTIRQIFDAFENHRNSCSLLHLSLAQFQNEFSFCLVNRIQLKFLFKLANVIETLLLLLLQPSNGNRVLGKWSNKSHGMSQKIQFYECTNEEKNRLLSWSRIFAEIFHSIICNLVQLWWKATIKANKKVIALH